MTTTITSSAVPASATANPVLRVTDAARSFGATRALDRVSLDLRSGELLALLGPNGAGKTTLIRAIAGRVRLEGGTIELLGSALDSADGRDTLGIVPQEIAIYPLLSARENLEAFGALHGVPKAEVRARADWALEWTGLADRSKDLVKTFSGG